MKIEIFFFFSLKIKKIKKIINIIISDNNIGKTFSHWSQSVKQIGVSTQ